jgi:hypothetical protein
MDFHDIEQILQRYTPLDLAVQNTAGSFCMANPSLRLEVTLCGGVVDPAFLRRMFLTADGQTKIIADKDGKLEARQVERIYAFDRDGTLLGAHQWATGELGTPADLIELGRFSQAVDYAILTHREWFGAGTVPVGIPEAVSSYTNTLRAELEITIYGGTAVPSPGSSDPTGKNREGRGA